MLFGIKPVPSVCVNSHKPLSAGLQARVHAPVVRAAARSSRGTRSDEMNTSGAPAKRQDGDKAHESEWPDLGRSIKLLVPLASLLFRCFDDSPACSVQESDWVLLLLGVYWTPLRIHLHLPAVHMHPRWADSQTTPVLVPVVCLVVPGRDWTAPAQGAATSSCI